MQNANSHIILYAKGHYVPTNDLLADLKVLLAERSGCKPEHINRSDMATVLFTVLEQCLPNISYRKVRELMIGLSPDEAWKSGGKAEEDFDTRLFRVIISEIALSTYLDEAGEPLYAMDEPKEELFPLSNP